MARISVLVGMLTGLAVSIPLGLVDWSDTQDSPIFGLAIPFYFGYPEFVAAAIFAMCIVSLVTMVEATGDVLAIGEITGKDVNDGIADTLRADGAATVLGGIFNTFQYTAFAQNLEFSRLLG